MTTSPPPTLVINLFGPMRVLVAGQQLPNLRSRKGLWLLALLTLRHGKSVAREWLAATLWPDLDQRQAYGNLRPILSDLRSRLGSEGARLQSPDRNTLLLDLEGAEADVLTFDRALAHKTLSSLEQAVALYRGPLLEGVAEEWVFSERLVREHACLQALQTLADTALAEKDLSAAAGYYQQAVGIDPFQETARRGWMEALAGAGNRNAALQIYRDFVELLRDDPGATPDEETVALYARLRTEARRPSRPEPTAPTTVPSPAKAVGYLPHPLTELVGREDECLEIADRLRHSRLVTLTGIGGIGKTRMAIQVAAEVGHQFADGIWLVPLEAIAGGKQIVTQVAAVLELQEESGRSLLQTIIHHLHDRRALLVIDNCEHLLESSAHLATQLLQACRGLRILATSRTPLGVTGEAVWPLPSLTVPDTAHLPQNHATLLRVLSGYESVQLFVERAQSAQKGFVLTDRNARAVAEICACLEGIPLAIEIAASRVRAMTIEQISAQMRTHSGLHASGNRAATPRHQTLQSALDWSYALLSEAARILLARLAIFAGGWSLEAAEQVCACESIRADQMAELLTNLVDRSLVLFDPSDPPREGRYRLLEIVRQYAASKLPCEEQESIRAVHAQWCLAFVEEVTLQLRSPDLVEGKRRLMIEQDNLRHALAWKPEASHEAQIGLRLVGALVFYWYQSGRYGEGRTHLERQLAQEVAQPQTLERAKALYGLGLLVHLQGEVRVAQNYIEESLSLYRRLSDAPGIAIALMELGHLASSSGDFAMARTRYQESLQQYRALNSALGVADSLGNLASIALSQGDYTAARSLFTESLERYTELQHPHRIAWVSNQLGLAALGQGDYATAQTYLEESLQRYSDQDAKSGMIEALGNLSLMRYEQGDFAVALVLLEQHRALVEELDDRGGIAWAHCQQGRLQQALGDLQAARALIEEGLALYRQLGSRRSIGMALHFLGVVAQDQGEYATAWELLLESLTHFHQTDTKSWIESNLFYMARGLFAMGELEMATRFWGASVSRHRRLSPPDKTRHECEMNQAKATLGDDAFTSAWTAGVVMTSQEATNYAENLPLSCLATASSAPIESPDRGRSAC